MNPLVTTAISISAFILSVINFIISRRAAAREAIRKERDDLLRIDDCLKNAFDLIYGTDGYKITKDASKLSEAEVLIRQALKIDPLHPRAIEYEGHLFECHGNNETALNRYKKSIAIDGTRSRPHNCVGLLSEGDAAIACFKKAIGLDPEGASIYYYNLGCAYLNQKKHSMAEDSFKSALKLRPVYAAAQRQLGLLNKALEKFDSAKTHFEKAIESDPLDTESMVHYGALLMESHKHDEEGKYWLERASKLRPFDDFPVQMLAAIYADRKQPDLALKYASAAMEINPRLRFATHHMKELTEEMQKLATRSDVT